eukprot:TRINITY_DN31052_c0_g1_i1.p1 TRINITY_DN31052_c0_g1~~TRINITY_DN31052_c0_g1_i1.p1  ORF type:complete len:365 (+),score=79.09 TRINITY_DN31052_c0_g1_i1:63-1097(+)
MNIHQDSAVYGVDAKCRALAAAVDPSQHLFLVGTLTLKGVNQIYLLEYKEDSAFCGCLARWSHPQEIWQIACCPSSAQKDLFFTLHTTTDFKSKAATLWTKEQGTSAGLEKIMTLPEPLDCVTWEPQGYNLNTVVGVSGDSVKTMKLDAEGAVETSIPTPSQPTRVAWDPHHSDVTAVACGGEIVKADLRTKEVESLVTSAHPTVLDIEYNPNKQYHVATSGDDGAVKFWDVRRASESLRVIQAHDHWSTCVKHNPFHEQLILTASTDRDATVKLWNLPTLASHTAPKHPTDNLLRPISDFDDSVYSVTWSAASPWLFASVSYNGKVMVHQVPRETKYSILLSD